MREGSQNSSAGTLSARYRNPSERPKMRERLKNNDGNVFGRLGHRRQSAFERLSDTYSPSTTKSGPDRANSRDRSHSRGRPHRRDSYSRDRPRSRDRSHGVKESYGNTCSSYRMGARHVYHSRDRDRSRSMKIGRVSESPLSRVSVTTSSKKILKEAEVRHGNFKVDLHPNFLDQEVAIGGTLSAKGRTGLCTLLKENLNISAWQPSDMTGVPRSVAEHRLNIREGYSPVRQNKRGHPVGSRETSRGRNHERSLLSRLAVQYSHGERA
ncbi:hypothetical protein Tco_0562061 [Tanacetum coccineum]